MRLGNPATVLLPQLLHCHPSERVSSEKLIFAEEKSGFDLIGNAELEEIYRLWELNKSCVRYREDYAVNSSSKITRPGIAM